MLTRLPPSYRAALPFVIIGICVAVMGGGKSGNNETHPTPATRPPFRESSFGSPVSPTSSPLGLTRAESVPGPLVTGGGEALRVSTRASPRRLSRQEVNERAFAT